MDKKDLFGICPYVTSQKVLSGKWSIYLLYLLKDGPVRFNELKRMMPEEITHYHTFQTVEISGRRGAYC